MKSSNAAAGGTLIKKRKRPCTNKNYIFLDSPESEPLWNDSELSFRDTNKINMQIKVDLSKEEFDASKIVASSIETTLLDEETTSCGFTECKTAGNYRPISFPIKITNKMWTCHASSVNDIIVDDGSNDVKYYPLVMVPPIPGEFPYPWVPCGAYMPMPMSNCDSCDTFVV